MIQHDCIHDHSLSIPLRSQTAHNKCYLYAFFFLLRTCSSSSSSLTLMMPHTIWRHNISQTRPELFGTKNLNYNKETNSKAKKKKTEKEFLFSRSVVVFFCTTCIWVFFFFYSVPPPAQYDCFYRLCKIDF